MMPDLMTIDEILNGVYNSGRMADWKIAETKAEDILPWIGRDQAKAQLERIMAVERLDELSKLPTSGWTHEDGHREEVVTLEEIEYSKKLLQQPTKGGEQV